MHITAKADYAVRAVLELTLAEPGQNRKAEAIADAQAIPLSFMENIFGQLRSAGIVGSQRGPDGGYRLLRSPELLTLAEVIRAVEGPLATVRGQRPEDLEYIGAAAPLQAVWIALRANLREVLEQVTVADVAGDRVPEAIVAKTAGEDAWKARL